MTTYRNETDALGERRIPAEALHGIHTARAVENFFQLSGRAVHPDLIRAYGLVKQACARTNHELGFLDDAQARALEQACAEMAAGSLDAHLLVDALQGGAGTSTNMNVNEVLANRALQLLSKAPGDYDALSPTEHVNLHQSTNDTYPTALKVAAIRGLRRSERDVVGLLEAFQTLERKTASVVKIGRTQMQDAVLTTLGREMGAYAEALRRDRWRIYKCEERLRVVNLGGTAIGTGLGAPRRFIFRAVEHLRDLTGLGLARAENLVEATQNADAFVEVSGILKACASNLLKISTDLRLLSSGPDAGFGEIHLPARQAGSSIMPGKVNPVIPEAVTQAALVICANDVAITQACSMGSLELNPFMPLIADALLTSIGLLGRASRILRDYCVSGIEPDERRCRSHVDSSTAAATALVEAIGYDAAVDAAVEARRTGADLRDVVVRRGLMDGDTYEHLIAPDRVNRLGGEVRRHP